MSDVDRATTPEDRAFAYDYAAAHPLTYAGSWVVNESGAARYTVAFTDAAAQHRAAVPRSVGVVQRPNSLAELETIAEAVFEVFPKCGRNVLATTIDVESSRVEVEIISDGEDDDITAIAQEKWSDRVRLTFVPESSVERTEICACALASSTTIVVWWLGSEDETGEASVLETSTDIRISLLVRRFAASTLGLEYANRTEVKLAEAIGERKIVDDYANSLLTPRPQERWPGQVG